MIFKKLKPIAYCEPGTACLPTESTVNLARHDGAVRASTSTSAFHATDVLDVVMDDITEQVNSTPSVHLPNTVCCHTHESPDSLGQHRSGSRHTVGLVPRNFTDLLPADEDINPSDTFGSDLPSAIENIDPPPRRIQRVILTLRRSLQTACNAFGLCRQYPRQPSFEPDRLIPSSLLSSSCPTTTDSHDAQTPRLLPEPPYPFPNMTTYRLMTWMNSGSHQKSETEVACLVADVIQAEDFNPSDLDDFSVRRNLRVLDNVGKETVMFPDDWLETDITLDIPTKSKDDPSVSFNIPSFHYRPLVGVICSAFADIQASAFHLFPFKRLWKDPLDNHQE